MKTYEDTKIHNEVREMKTQYSTKGITPSTIKIKDTVLSKTDTDGFTFLITLVALHDTISESVFGSLRK